MDDEITREEAEEYIATLIESQILVPDIALGVTGPEPIHTLIEQFSRHPVTTPVAKTLGGVRTTLAVAATNRNWRVHGIPKTHLSSPFQATLTKWERTPWAPALFVRQIFPEHSGVGG